MFGGLFQKNQHDRNNNNNNHNPIIVKNPYQSLIDKLLEMKEFLATSFIPEKGTFYKWLDSQPKLPKHQQLTKEELNGLMKFSAEFYDILYPNGKCDNEKVAKLKLEKDGIDEKYAEEENIEKIESKIISNLKKQMQNENVSGVDKLEMEKEIERLTNQLEETKKKARTLWLRRTNVVEESIAEKNKENAFKEYVNAITSITEKKVLPDGNMSQAPIMQVFKDYPAIAKFLDANVEFLYGIADKFYTYFLDKYPDSEHQYKKNIKAKLEEQEKETQMKKIEGCYFLACEHYKQGQYEEIYPLLEDNAKRFHAESLHFIAILLAKGQGCKDGQRDLETASKLLFVAYCSTSDHQVKVKIAETMERVYVDMTKYPSVLNEDINYANVLFTQHVEMIINNNDAEGLYQLAKNFKLRHDIKMHADKHLTSTNDLTYAKKYALKAFELSYQSAKQFDVKSLIQLSSILADGLAYEKDLVTPPDLLLAAYLSTDDITIKENIVKEMAKIYKERADTNSLLEANDAVDYTKSLLETIERKAEFTANGKKGNPEHLQLQRFYQLGEAYLRRYEARVPYAKSDEKVESDLASACNYFLRALKIGHPKEVAAVIEEQLQKVIATTPKAKVKLEALRLKIEEIKDFHKEIDEKIRRYNNTIRK